MKKKNFFFFAVFKMFIKVIVCLQSVMVSRIVIRFMHM